MATLFPEQFMPECLADRLPIITFIATHTKTKKKIKPPVGIAMLTKV
jgi:hypothetical protein